MNENDARTHTHILAELRMKIEHLFRFGAHNRLDIRSDVKLLVRVTGNNAKDEEIFQTRKQHLLFIDGESRKVLATKWNANALNDKQRPPHSNSAKTKDQTKSTILAILPSFALSCDFVRRIAAIYRDSYGHSILLLRLPKRLFVCHGVRNAIQKGIVNENGTFTYISLEVRRTTTNRPIRIYEYFVWWRVVHQSPPAFHTLSDVRSVPHSLNINKHCHLRRHQRQRLSMSTVTTENEKFRKLIKAFCSSPSTCCRWRE